ncbi:Superoxide dismutase [Mn] [Talaromyces pinophilus]|nr:Superoxide dismutase [Mn] [Talaromyces pinophilus]
MSVYTLPPLPYGYNALEPVISEEIMIIHHTKHHQAQSRNYDLPTLLALQQKINFNGGGHINHELFWQNLAPQYSAETNIGTVAPSIKAAIESKWGSLDGFIKDFNQTLLSIQGSGWGWLVAKQDPGMQKTRSLEIIITKDEDSVVTLDESVVPLLGIDMWEHAYYLQYKHDKADYVHDIWTIVNWKVVEERFSKSIQGH